ncbi:MAG TPA: excinuclease ABC subunit UvrC [Propioniciclava sp.]|jgi:excinuclease ABC subunit C|uniref:excinuclease ABC subunit UvrC n=1 Tax=Propioniciclava sp. TaxID=2038686 RepID=UPI002BF556A1|nr:excinuclease ABC subunit UvrC [Propioniciclava sp.]HRL50353.1 excinuclease ABC subunit UvrC [Propioniciclava sp.]HRL78780.1 excinuclease ABC subunit UvrC [Propioniciclava sp.]
MADPASYRPAPGTIPTQPGVYRFSDPAGTVIYVGKAKNLRQRLNSYFADPANLHFRTQTMVRTAAKVEWTVVQNELESLQLEYTWIKQYDPRFNIKYRDDKTYPWVCITASDEFPRVFVGRGAHKKGYRYFGPYAQAWAIRDTVDSLLRIFPMRSCTNGVFRSAASSGRPCLLGYIGKCSAPCVGRIDADAHRAIVEEMSDFLAGNTNRIVRRMRRAMEVASDNLEFERAAMLRDQLGALESATEKNAIVLPDGTDADVIAVSCDDLEVAIQVFHVRGGRVRGERGWVADRSDDSSLEELIETFCLQLYAGPDGSVTSGAVPREVLLPVAPASGVALEDLLSEARGSRVRVHVPQRGDKRVLLDTVARNAAEALMLHKTRRASDLSTRNRALEEIGEALGLDTPPLRIECYDISHLQGTEVVASMVVFEDGLPRKSEYRRFVIKTVEGSNDVGAMHEVITRRFRRYLEDQASLTGEDAVLKDATTGVARKFAYKPSLLIVDGGAPQVAAAQAAMSELGITDVPVVGLAKRLEEVWIPQEEFPLILPRTSEGLYLLQRARDEAHRFAITHHRGRRSKSMVDSLLDQVPGLGELRRKAVLKHFGSLRKLRAAHLDDIAAVPGIGPKTALAIKLALDAEPAGEAINTATGEVLPG